MMHHVFLDEIAQRIPQKEERIDVLADMLSISRKAVNSRLQGEVPFAFHEAMIISRQLNIFLDTLKLDNLPMLKPLFKFNQIENTNPIKTSFALSEEMVSILKFLKNFPDAEGGEVTNILPQPLYVAYQYVFRFYLFKWKYQTKGLNKVVPYKDVIIEDKLQKIQKENVKWAKILHTEYILDNLIFQYLVNDINYFYQIRLITDEEINLIKRDLLKILEQIDRWSSEGFFEETGKRINIYISDINIETSYVYINAPDYQLTMAKTFLLNGIVSTERTTFEEMKQWVQSIKQQSFSITRSGERKRVEFLKKQYNLIETLPQV
ncbi:MAG: hypothetical protein LBQ60_05045 [Bacteroidales bacterium]|nr:hypothetical protein [Bacteroidales bacterium]